MVTQNPQVQGRSVDPLGDRMKRYEKVPEAYLMRRVPVIGRIDGRAFHTLTRTMEKPFDEEFIDAMGFTAMTLAKEVQGCRLAYVQSDEISLLLVDYEKLDSQSWFDSRLSKMISIAASIATEAFNGEMNLRFKKQVGAYFDARFFNLQKEEVCNYFLWRQRDATRNAVSAYAQANFSHKQLQGLNQLQLREKLLNEKNVDLEKVPPHHLMGLCCTYEFQGAGSENWKIQTAPDFGKQREFVENLLKGGEE